MRKPNIIKIIRKEGKSRNIIAHNTLTHSLCIFYRMCNWKIKIAPTECRDTLCDTKMKMQTTIKENMLSKCVMFWIHVNCFHPKKKKHHFQNGEIPLDWMVLCVSVYAQPKRKVKTLFKKIIVPNQPKIPSSVVLKSTSSMSIISTLCPLSCKTLQDQICVPYPA